MQGMRTQGMRTQGMPMGVIEARGEVSSLVPGGPNSTNVSSQVTRHAKNSSLQALHVGECGCREGTPSMQSFWALGHFWHLHTLYSLPVCGDALFIYYIYTLTSQGSGADGQR